MSCERSSAADKEWAEYNFQCLTQIWKQPDVLRWIGSFKCFKWCIRGKKLQEFGDVIMDDVLGVSIVKKSRPVEEGMEQGN